MMPTSFTLRGAFIAAATITAVAIPSAPAAAAVTPRQLPCVPGVNCPPPPPPACAGADATPAAGNLGVVRRATLCLLNKERADRGLAKLRANRPLRGVATRYARSMEAQNFFDHVAPSGSTFVQRIKRSRYLRGANGYTVGENLGWGGGPLATPRNIVRSWMGSAGHRANILNGKYRDIGIGVSVGTPVPGVSAGATYVNLFGVRG